MNYPHFTSKRLVVIAICWSEYLTESSGQKTAKKLLSVAK
jgi:hypothetical protein